MTTHESTGQSISLHLSEAEALRLADLTPDGCKPQDTIRALIALADTAVTRKATSEGLRVPGTPINVPGQTRGYEAADYQRALTEGGNIAAAARILGVHRKSVQEMVKLHELAVPAR